MNQSEKDHIGRCKQLIETQYHFSNVNGSLRQRDLEYLSDMIEEKAGIRLSLSTLKRLWKKDYDQTPHPSTLDALAALLGHKSWQDFKLTAAPITDNPVMIISKSRKKIWKASTILPAILAVAVLFWLIAFRSGNNDKSKPVINGPITFTGNKTVSEGVPNTVIFNYDLETVDADSFFFQQAWNEKERVRIDQKGKSYSNIYYYPGFHKAKLVANDSIVSRFRVHITTGGWLPLVNYTGQHEDNDQLPVYLKKNNFLKAGQLHATLTDIAAAGVKTDRPFMLSYYNIREFENTNSDNFSLSARIVCDSNNTVACPGFELVIVCEEHIFFVRLMGKGCERDIALKMGEKVLHGVSNDLSVFGRDMHHLQNLKVEVVDKKAKIYLDDKVAYTLAFQNDFGKIMGLVCNFAGTGAVDHVRLKNGEGKTVYEDEFGY